MFITQAWKDNEKETHSVTGVEIILDRYTVRFFFTYYCPLCAMVLISWISFSVSPDSVPGRVGLLVTVFLVLTTLFGNIQVTAKDML